MERSGIGGGEPCYEVVWPLGRFVSQAVPPAPPLADLNGKTVAQVWDWVFKGDEIYAIVNEELRKRFPGIRIIDHVAMGNSHAENERQYVANLPKRLVEMGCDAVISAVGA